MELNSFFTLGDALDIIVLTVFMLYILICIAIGDKLRLGRKLKQWSRSVFRFFKRKKKRTFNIPEPKLEEIIDEDDDCVEDSVFLIEDYHSRRFLNKVSYTSPASVILEIESNEYSVQITDCSRKVNLHGYLGKKEGRDNAKFKLGSLIKELTDMYNHLEIECARVDGKTNNQLKQ